MPYGTPCQDHYIQITIIFNHKDLHVLLKASLPRQFNNNKPIFNNKLGCNIMTLNEVNPDSKEEKFF